MLYRIVFFQLPGCLRFVISVGVVVEDGDRRCFGLSSFFRSADLVLLEPSSEFRTDDVGEFDQSSVFRMDIVHSIMTSGS